MFCEKCGTPIADGERFCGNCGAPVMPAQQPQVQPAVPTFEQPMAASPAVQQPDGAMYAYQPVPEQPRKKNGKKRAAIIVGAVAACAVIFVVIALVTGMFKSEKSHMHEVTKDSVHSLFTRFDDIADDIGMDNPGNFSLEIEPGDILKTLGSSSGVDISWLKNVRLDVATDTSDDGKITVSAGVVLNDVEIGQLYGILDTATSELLLGADGLSDHLGSTSLNLSSMKNLGALSYYLPTGMMSQITEVLDDVDSEKVADVLEKYIFIAIDAIDSFDESKGTVTANGVTADCTVYTITLSQKTLMNMVKDLLSKAVDDGDLKDLLKTVYPMIESMTGGEAGDFDSFYSEFKASIRTTLDTMDEAAEYISDDPIYIIREYVNGDEMIGFGLEAQEAGFSAFFGYAEDGDSFGMELTAMGQTFLKGSGTKDGDKLNGDLQVILNDQPMVNLKLVGYNPDNGEGAIEVSFSSNALSTFGVNSQMATVMSTLSLKLEKVDKGLAVDVNVMGQSAVKATLKTGGKKSLAVNTNLPVEDIQTWLGSLDVNTLISRLSSAGVPQELLNSLSAALN